MMAETMHKWAEDMLEIIKLVAPNVEHGLGGMASPEGAVVTRTGGDKLIDLFVQKGYSPYEQVDGLWVIESIHDESSGATIDFRVDRITDHGTCVINWFDDSDC